MAGQLLHAGRRAPLWVLCALVVGAEAVLVLWVLGRAGAPPLGGDAAPYDLLATNLAHGHGFSQSPAAPYEPCVLRAPGYPALLAVLELLGAGSQLGIRLAQFAMLAATATVVGHVGTLLHGPRAGRLAALLCATYLPLVWLSTWEMTEVPAGLGAAVVALLAVRALRASGPAPGAWALTGLALALTCYVRPSFLLVAGPMAVAIALGGTGSWRGRGRWLPAAAFLAAVAAALAPWTARNLALAGAVVPLASSSGGSLYASAQQWDGRLSFAFDTRDWVSWKAESRRIARPYRERGFAPRDQLAYDRAFAAQAPWGAVGAGDVLRRLPDRLAHLWGPADTTPADATWSDAARRLGIAQFAALLALVLAGGLARGRRLAAEWPVWILAAYLTVLHLVFHVELRYTVPARPLLALYAALGLLAVAGRARTAPRRQGAPPQPSSA